MKHVMTVASIAGLIAAGSAAADFFAPGIDNSWDATTPMVETALGSGVWEYTATGQGAGTRLLWDILDISGDWNSKVHPAGNQVAFADAGGNLTLSYDTNVYADGWLPESGRVGVSHWLDTWVVTGDWVDDAGVGGDWDIGGAPAMSDAGGGIYTYTVDIPAGIYAWKPVVNVAGDGSWDSISTNSRNVNADNASLEVVAGLETVTFWVNAAEGTIRSTAIPAPGILGIAGLAGVVGLRRRR